MRFYYENNMGDYGVFSEDNLVKAIYTAWNIEANLYLINNDVKVLKCDKLHCQAKPIFFPWEDNEVNSELLKPYGYYMDDGESEREIRKIDTDEVVKYDWHDVKQLV